MSDIANREAFLDQRFFDLLNVILLDVGLADETTITVVPAVPQEQVIEESMIPGITYHLIDDSSLAQATSTRERPCSPVDENDLSLGYELSQRPTYRRFTYQFDLYTYYRQFLLQLTKEFHKRLPREFGVFVDSDGYEVSFRQTGFQDFTEDIEEERLFKRCLTYEFDCWAIDDDEATDTVGVILEVITDLIDDNNQDILDQVTVS